MRVLTIILAAVAAGLEPTALADPYKDLAAKGYRWVSVDGPRGLPHFSSPCRFESCRVQIKS